MTYARLALACLVVAAAGSIAAWLLQPEPEVHPEAPAVRAEVARLTDAVRAGKFHVVWDALDEETREQFASSHAGLLRSVEHYATARQDPAAPRIQHIAADRTEREHGMTLDELAKTTTRSLWLNRAAREVGHGRFAYAGFTIDRLRMDDERATVDTTLANGRPQGFHFVKRGERWRLIDFHAYWPSKRWTVERSTISFGEARDKVAYRQNDQPPPHSVGGASSRLLPAGSRK